MTQPNHHFGNKPYKLTNIYRKSNSIEDSYDIELSGCANNNSQTLPGIFPQQQRVSVSLSQQLSSTSSVVDYCNQSQQVQQQQQQHDQQHPQQPPSVKNNQNSTNQKFSIFSKLNNVHKLNAFDNLLVAATSSSILDDGEDLTEEKKSNMQTLMEQSLSDEAKQQITFILEKISLLKPAEKLLLYLKMPGGYLETDPLKQSQNPLGSRSEINHTINWVRSHLEHDPNVSIPKQEVYEDYIGYCARIGIKPLSTADFGKVMKQVFPDIRPRRLGTRGHSRYCYAAMRKATKLDPPKLPDISNKSDPVVTELEKEEKAWKVIKSWSENFLNSQFSSIADLADHITKNNLNSPVSSTSRQLLQKKLLQREIKERKKLNNQALKKRRKKRKKTSSTSSDQPTNAEETQFDENIEIKKELDDELDDDNGENLEEQSDNSGELLQPMNLTNPEQLPQQQQQQQQQSQISSVESHGTNLIATCDTTKTSGSVIQQQHDDGNASEKSDIKIKLKNKIITSAEMQQQVESSQRQDEESLQTIFCKKVRQAQQAKALSMLQDGDTNKNVLLQKDDPEYPTQMLMPSKIPAKRKSYKDISHLLKRARQHKANNSGNPSPLNHVEPSDLVFKKDDLTNEILPRERFDSICNMDKNALDSYLNLNEENSQDPELLQYFGDDKTENSPDEDNLEEPGNADVPLLMNYPMYGDGKMEKNHDKISQLRSMLEQNIQGSPHLSSGVAHSPTIVANPPDNSIKTLLLNKSPLQSGNPSSCNLSNNSNNNNSNNQDQLNLYPGSASASLAIMSQRHHNVNPNTTQTPMNLYRNAITSSSNQNNLSQNVPHSPNTRRKNLNFVPIPSQKPSNKVKNQVQINPVFQGDPCSMSPFVSPRNTPNLKRSKSSHPNLPTLNVHENKTNSVMNPCDTGFSHPQQQFKMEPVSAPPSPSMIPTCRFGSQTNNSSFHFTPLTNVNPTVNYPVESRSQSVPPHCTNPYNFNNGFSSACSSVAPTPAPSEYADFSDTNILDIFNNEQPPTIKMEANDILTDLLEHDNLGQTNSEAEMLGMSETTTRNNFVNSSRSVPTTPLPYGGYNSNNNNNNSSNFCALTNNNNNVNPVGKSVPTTPISGYNPFRYSPDLLRTRDFLINGFNVNNNNNNNNNNINDKNIKQSPIHLPLSNGPVTVGGSNVGASTFAEMDDIPSFDTNMLNNL